ncbi:MAG: NIPSNAP family protein [Pseudomonadota bacterium]
MIFERRAYTPRPGKGRLFFEAQERTGYPKNPLWDHKVSYFNALSGPTDQIVHYWTYEDLGEWQATYDVVYSNEMVQEYLGHVRPLFLKQGYEFFAPAPIEQLSPYFSDDKRWTVGDPPIADFEEQPELVVEEQIISLNPGALPDYWEAYRAHGLAATQDISESLIGVFRTLLGTQYQVLILRWHQNLCQMSASNAALRQSSAWQAFQDAITPMVSEQHTQILSPWAVPQMAPLFYKGVS